MPATFVGTPIQIKEALEILDVYIDDDPGDEIGAPLVPVRDLLARMDWTVYRMDRIREAWLRMSEAQQVELATWMVEQVEAIPEDLSERVGALCNALGLPFTEGGE